MVRWLVGGAIAVYLAVVVVMFAFQRTLMYPVPQTARTSPAAAGFPEAEEIVLDTADGEKIIAWHVAPRPGKPVVMFFHGNGDVLAWRVPTFRAITADGTGLVAVSFRGYAGSSGRPTEQGLLNDGAAAYAFASERYGAERLVAWGYSLGTGVAVAMAATRPVGKVILEAPYTSTVDVAAMAFPWLPVRGLLHDTFRSDRRIAALKAPLLILHGEKDAVIPIAFGRRLFDLAPQPKRFVALPLATHVDLDAYGAIDIAHAFMNGAG